MQIFLLKIQESFQHYIVDMLLVRSFLRSTKYWVQKFNKEQNKATGFISIDTIIPSEISIRYPNGVELAMPSETSMKIIRELIQYGNLCSQ